MDLWATLRAHGSSVRSVELAPAEGALWTGDENGWAIWWSLETRRPKAIWQAHTNAFLAIRRMPGTSDQLVTHGRDNKLCIWRLDPSKSYNTAVLTPDAVSSDYTNPLLVHSQDVNALNFCAAAVAVNLVAVPATTGSEGIDVYTVKPFQRPHKALKPPELEPAAGIVMALAWTDDNQLVAGYESGNIVVYQEGLPVLVTRPHVQPVLSITISAGRVWSTAADKRIASFMFNNGAEILTTKIGGGRGVASFNLCPGLGLASAAGWDGQVRLFTFKPSGELQLITEFSAGRTEGITVSDLNETPSSLQNHLQRRLRPWPAAFLAVGGKDGRIALYGLKMDVVVR